MTKIYFVIKIEKLEIEKLEIEKLEIEKRSNVEVMTSRGSEKLKTSETKKVKKVVLFDSFERPTTGYCVTAATAYSALSKDMNGFFSIPEIGNF